MVLSRGGLLVLMMLVVAVKEISATSGIGFSADDHTGTITSADLSDIDAPVDTTLNRNQKMIRAVREVVREFDRFEDEYIEPPHYEFAVEMRATRNYEDFILSSNGQSIMFSPDQRIKVGPYFGWRWIFLGTTFDLKNIRLFGDSGKREFDLAIYSSQVGVDLFYRRTGSDYKLREVRMGYGIDGGLFDGTPFDGISVGITGVNAYYIFNHHHFSYPAAFSPGVCQKISCGSWLAGVGYTQNTLELDFDKLQQLVEHRLTGGQQARLDSGMMFNSVRYHDISLSAGYAYTWVLMKNLIFCASGQAAVAYKTSNGHTVGERDGFSFNKVNLDGIGRFALVYNNMRWYAGVNAILRTNNYHTSRFAANNIFGSFNAYIGFNFLLKEKYRQSGKSIF